MGETDGTPVPPPSDPFNFSSKMGGRCSDELHDECKVLGQDTKDPLTNGTNFKTYCPLWDPCYWCAYDHDHLSDPYTITGYQPRFGYTALKNYLQDESHGGFKGMLMRHSDLHVCFQLRAHLSGHTRFTVQFHSVVIVIANAITHEVLVELHNKADFGFASTQQNPAGLMAASKKDLKIRKEQVIRRMFTTR